MLPDSLSSTFIIQKGERDFKNESFDIQERTPIKRPSAYLMRPNQLLMQSENPTLQQSRSDMLIESFDDVR